MSRFAADWLALREPYDEAARDAPLAARLGAWLRPADRLRVLDLAAGTGANLRYLAPCLGGCQHWTLVDHDAELLAAAAPRSAAWAGAHGLAVTPCPSGFHLSGPNGLRADARLERYDLAGGLDGLMPAGFDLLTASALFDLVSGAWCEALTDAAAAAGLPVLFALTFDGSIDWRPAEAEDAEVTALIGRHQRDDKGFGPALGPAAPERLAAALAARGYRVAAADSSWRIGPSGAAMQAALLADWAAAGRETAPQAAGRIDAWAERRGRHIRAGRSHLHVGHRDILGLPPLTP